MKLLIVLLTFALVVTSALAQPAAPVWLSQLKLSGLNGVGDQRLAVINGKTFSRGEAYDLKVGRKIVSVKCLEIGEDSVLVQIQDLPGAYALTLSGQVIPLTPTPAVASPPAVAPASPPVQPPQALVFTMPVAPSQADARVAGLSFKASFPPIYFWLAVVCALLVGIALGIGASLQFQHLQNQGEAMVAETISQQLSRPHLLLNNLTLPMAGGTTQIDHVLVADTGIFVIETKHYKGWIFGRPEDSQWTYQHFKFKARFQNPLRQNFAHVKALQAMFDLPENHFQSVVVFTGTAVFKTDLGPNVVQLAGLIPFLAATRPVVFDERKMAYIIGRIEMKRARRSLETDEYHINHVRQKIAGRISPPSPSPIVRSPPPANPIAAGSSDEKYQPKK